MLHISNLQSVHILSTYQLGLVSNVCKMIFDRVNLTSKKFVKQFLHWKYFPYTTMFIFLPYAYPRITFNRSIWLDKSVKNLDFILNVPLNSISLSLVTIWKIIMKPNSYFAVRSVTRFQIRFNQRSTYMFIGYYFLLHHLV